MEDMQILLEKAGKYLAENYTEGFGENPWGASNELEVHQVSVFMSELISLEILPYAFSRFDVHYTCADNESTYDDMGTRFVVWDRLTLVFACHFDEIIEEQDREFKGLKKEGFEKLIRACFDYLSKQPETNPQNRE